MSDLVPSVVPLSAGLSLQVPKLMAPPGSLTNVLNYEQVDLQGQKRIDGYARYDGSALSAFDDFQVLDGNTPLTGYTSEAGLLLKDGQPVGVILGFVGSDVHLLPLNENGMPPTSPGTSVYSDPEEHYQLLLYYMRLVRQNVEKLPGAVAGLHWFRDRLYAVADTARITVESGVPIYPNDVLSATGAPAKVLTSVQTSGNTYHVSLSVMDSYSWATVGMMVYKNGDFIGQTLNWYPDEQAPTIASFYESRSEMQAVSEDGTPFADYGWRFVDLGWSVKFREGLSLYGGLPSLNQNLGAIGSGWSGTGGNTGSPLVLTQNINISNDRGQVNGWKNSNTPTSYGLSPSNITTLDSAFIYADAYVSWDGETRVITVAKDNLIEYPATATVEVSPE